MAGAPMLPVIGCAIHRGDAAQAFLFEAGIDLMFFFFRKPGLRIAGEEDR